ncbi:MAG: hypothetical protein H0X30_25345 [Anaerolineae bacterium]|nr:hypothetical protein [Anaerolineae bacterium]
MLTEMNPVQNVESTPTDAGVAHHDPSVLEMLQSLPPKQLKLMSDLVEVLGMKEETLPPSDKTAADIAAFHADTTHLHDRHDILLTASEYSLGVVKTGEEPPRNDDYEYRDLEDLQPLVDEGLLELQRHEIRVSGETVDIYALTDKGRAEIGADEPTSEPEAEAEPLPTEEPTISKDQSQTLIMDRLGIYVISELMTSLLIPSYTLNTDGEMSFLWRTIQQGLTKGFEVVDAVALSQYAETL